MTLKLDQTDRTVQLAQQRGTEFDRFPAAKHGLMAERFGD
jgi:hypothetical protein